MAKIAQVNLNGDVTACPAEIVPKDADTIAVMEVNEISNTCTARITLEYDPAPENPITGWDGVTVAVMDGYDYLSYNESIDTLARPYDTEKYDVLGDEDGKLLFLLDKLNTTGHAELFENYDGFGIIPREEVYRFNARHCGIIYCSSEDYTDPAKGVKNWIKTINQWIDGDVYGYRVEVWNPYLFSWDISMSCWGFYDIADTIEDAKNYVPIGAKIIEIDRT